MTRKRGFLVPALLAGCLALAAPAGAVQTAETQAAMTPDAALRAAVLGCIDSRVAPELVFDTGVGDLFAARIAGNTVEEELLGSLEFATRAAGARLIDGVEMGSLTSTLALLEPAVVAARAEVSGEHDSSNPAFVAHVTEANVRLGARALVERSAILAELVREGRLRVVPALYDVDTGKVEFLAP